MALSVEQSSHMNGFNLFGFPLSISAALALFVLMTLLHRRHWHLAAS
jgi:hypothetical protein